jgi:hypothetical protein
VRAPLVIALAVGLAALAWFALRGDETFVEDVGPAPSPEPPAATHPKDAVRIVVGDDPPPGAPTVGSPGTPVPVPVPAPTRPGGSDGPPLPAPVPYVPPPPPDKLPHGTLAIQVRDPDGNTVPPDTLRVEAEPVGGIHWTIPSAMRDERTGIWDFGSIPVGTLRIKVWGDHVVETNKDVAVREGERTDETIRVRWGGAFEYEVLLPNGERPEKVTLSLAQGRRPVKAYWQIRLEDVLTQPRLLPQFTNGPRGIAFGLPPGKYALTVQSDGAKPKTQDVEIVARRTAKLTIRLESP